VERAASPTAAFLDPHRFIHPIAAPSDRKVDVAIIIPTFRHSVFLVDAVVSALTQETAFEIRIVIVDDGCPHADTRRTAASLAAAHPGRIDYIRRRNGGLSAARNSGVNYALARWPTLRAIYFLDADNTIEPHAIDRAFKLLIANPTVGWIYPNIKMFGCSTHYYDFSGPYSILLHLKANFSDAASLVSRAVFDKGCRFDEEMRQGYEDWEFWMQCIEAGFIGQHLPDFGLRYRKRPESMLSESHRVHGNIIQYIHKKHAGLFNASFLQNARAPTVSVFLNTGVVHHGYRLDEALETTSTDFALQKFLRALHEPHLNTCPQILASTSAEFLDVLRTFRFGAYVTWWLETQLFGRHGQHLAAIRIDYDETASDVRAVTVSNGEWAPNEKDLHLVAFGPEMLRGALNDPRVDWIRSALNLNPEPSCVVLQVTLPGTDIKSARLPDALFTWFSAFKQLHLLYQGLTLQLPQSLPRSMRRLLDQGLFPAELLDCGPLLNLPKGGRKNVALVVPIFSFGGVEKVCINIAKQLQRRGYCCHLLVLGKTATLSEEVLSTFDSLIFYSEDSFSDWAGPTENLGAYLGSSYPTWTLTGDPHALEGLLLPMDVVINFHAAHLHKIAQKLKKAGVILANSVHVNDFTEYGREVGQAFLSLGYEHVYDLIAPCSEAILTTCNAFGVPNDKLVLIPNAPAHTPSPGEIEAVLTLRKARQSQARSLNILFLGRLDRQKGLDRVLASLRRSEALRLPLNWRCIGTSVVDGDDNAYAADLQRVAEPAVHDPKAMTEIYAWADVIYIPSYWEGLPLTILEAAQLGVIPIVSDVGAVAEAVEHGKTGYLIQDQPLETYVEAALKHMQILAADRGLLAQMSAQAVAGMTRNWEASTNIFIGRLEELLDLKAQKTKLARIGSAFEKV
jgi:glycosyltransferase involved in cell wall biosynthesis